MRNSGGKLDASSSVILNKTSQGGPINFLAQATQDAGELQESFNEAIYHDLTNVFQEKQKKKKNVPRPRLPSAVITEGAKNKWGGEGQRGGKETNKIVVIDRRIISIVLYRNVSIYCNCKRMRFCTSVSLAIHRYSIVRYIYIYICCVCVYIQKLPFETDRFSLFVANT